jgi:hypothetical protein
MPGRAKYRGQVEDLFATPGRLEHIRGVRELTFKDFDSCVCQ